MDLNKFISSGVLESYVLGTATVEETQMVNKLCFEHPEILNEIEAIETSLIAYAEEYAPEIPDSLKKKLYSQLIKDNKKPKVNKEKTFAVSEQSDTSTFYTFSFAACIVLLIISGVCNIIFYNKMKEAKSELIALNNEKNYYADQTKIQQTSLKNMGNDMAILSDPGIKTIRLKSTDAGKEAGALIYWNKNTRKTFINLTQLPAPPAGKQYQLWALDDGKPIDAGVFDLTDENIHLQKMNEIKEAQAFAVTLEVKGGSPTPTMSTLCLMGKI